MSAATAQTERSNSLQRMLQLERQAMIERLTAQNQSAQQPATSSKQSPTQQLAPIATKRKPASGPLTSHPPRLSIDTNTAIRSASNTNLVTNNNTNTNTKKTPPQLEMPQRIKVRRGTLEATTPPSIKYDSTIETLSARAPGGDRRSVCCSPSWDAYDRRKKDTREERKDMEEARKATGGKTRRLSKPPPLSSPYATAALGSYSSSNLGASNITGRKPRPLSCVDLSLPPTDGLYRQPRSRAGSFSSLLKAPFEFCRSSNDQSTSRTDTGAVDASFIGGIKLELERHNAQQKLLECQATLDEADVHPALRQSPVAHSSSAPVKPSSATPRNASKDSHRRAYPPITRMKTKSDTVPVISPTAPALPDLSNLDKWRGHASVGVSSKQTGLMSGPNSRCNFKIDNAQSTPYFRQTRQGVTQSMYNLTAAETESSIDSRLFQHMPKTEQTPSDDRPQTACLAGTVEAERKSPSPPPPEPPRRSSKRNSMHFLKGPLPSAATPDLPKPASASTPATDRAAGVRAFKLCPPSTAVGKNAEQTLQIPSIAPSASSSWENLHSSVMNTIDKEVRPMCNSEQAFWRSNDWAAGHLTPGHFSSSEDSASEDTHSLTVPSTPNTSRPQSEKEYPRTSIDGDAQRSPRIELYDSEHHYPDDNYSFNSNASIHQKQVRDAVSQDSIHAAAMKVVAAFPDMSPEHQSIIQQEYFPSPAVSDASVKSNQSILKQTPSHIRRKALSPTSTIRLNKLKESNNSNNNKESSAKVFVECCKCKYYHDLPSRLYESMMNANAVLSSQDKVDFVGNAPMTINCTWCKHDMSTACCSGFAAMVYIKERLH